MGIEARKQREFKRREREILDAALPLLSGPDWLSVTVDEIAAAAEVGKGTVYKHFESKEEVYGWLALDFQRLVLARIERIDPELPVIERLRAMIQIHWELHRTEHRYQRVLEYTMRDSFIRTMSPRLRTELDRLSNALVQHYLGTLQQGVAEQRFPPRDPMRMLVGPTAVVNGMIMMLWNGGLDEVGARILLEEATAYILAGLRADPM